MSNFSHLSDHAAVSKAHDILKEAITSQGKNSPLLNHLRQNHPDVYNILLSDCKTHGPGLKAAVRNFADDATKTPSSEIISSARKSLDIIAELPKEILVNKSKTGWWVAGIVAAVGIGAYLINEYGKPEKKEITPKSGDWKDRTEQSVTSEGRTL
jgi:hypothetical protein